MKDLLKRVMALAVALALLLVAFPVDVSAADGDIIVLYTNDIHCATEHYAVLAAYRAELIAQGHTVVTVDAGDHIQGEVIGSLTSGSAIIELMNAVGYDFAVPGNHEFDYGMDTYLGLAENSDFSYLSSNFVDLQTGNTVFDAYEILELNGVQVAFMGITTPECYTKSTPVYFQDEDGNFIYSFSEDTFYETIQDTVDAARADGAELVIAVTHLGIDGTTEGWKSTDVLYNTTGIDVFLDGHSHETIERIVHQNKDGQEVLLSSTGSKFEFFGQLTLGKDGAVELELIDPSSVDIDSSAAARAAYDQVKDIEDGYLAELSYLYEVLGTAEVELTLNDADGNWVIRTQETNMGNFVADAYRAVSGADTGAVNGGGVREPSAAGEATRKALIDVNPWNNEMCVILATGQQILDALEHGASRYPESSGGFLQVSGLSYEIRSYVDSPVVHDDLGNFVKVDGTKPRRVANVKVAGQAIDPEGTYTLVSNYYMLKQGGDGFTMFADAEVLEHDALPTDAEMLEEYFVEHLDGVVTKEQYGDIGGEGRIKIVTEEEEGIPGTGDTSVVAISMAAILAAVLLLKKKK